MFRMPGFILLSLVAALLLYAAAAWLLPYIAVNSDARNQGPDEVSIYIHTNGVHTDIVTPVYNETMDWRSWARFTDTDSKDTAMRYAVCVLRLGR